MGSTIGVIDGFNGRGVFGWVRREDESSAQSIDIHLDGVPVAARVRADRFRKDLAGSNGSHGQHGFVWDLPLSATFGERVTISIMDSDSGDVITEREFDAPYGDLPWRGNIREPEKRSLSGWVKKYGSIDPVVVDVYIDQTLIQAGVLCDSAVPASADVPADVGDWGFTVPVEGFRATGDTVEVSLRRVDDGKVVLAREVRSAGLIDSYRGRIEVSDNVVIRGWAVNENGPGDTFNVEVLVDGYPYLTLANAQPRGDLRKMGLSLGKGGIRFHNPLHTWLVDGTEHTMALRFPDGSLSDTFTFGATTRVSQGGSTVAGTPSSRNVTIIVPIYNAPDDVEVCIQRLLTFTPDDASILLIDDCSPDPRVSEILAHYSDEPRLTILSNTENLGFTRTVNRGIQTAGQSDVLLLNSDARVTPGWLDGMLAAAASSPRVATVTAMSDRAGAFSAPYSGNDNSLPPGVDEIAYARAFRRRSVGVYPRVPTGNGFCMWVSRACIDEIGGLDAEAFPRGYGEENDFSMRAGRAGWVHLIDDRTYVFHDRSKSFGDSKTELLAAGRAVVDARYPEYKNAIRVFRESPEIAIARNRAHLAQADATAELTVRPRVLYVISTTSGGTPQTNADLMGALDDSVEPWVLRCDSREITLSRVVDGELNDVCRHGLHDGIEPIGHFSPEYDSVVTAWLRHYDFDILHVRHLLWHSLSLPALAKQLGMKVVVSFHDYYALSPNLKLIDDRGVYLGNEFVASGSIYRDSGWPDGNYPTPTGDWLDWWQERFWGAIQMADAFVTTSASARELILQHFPEMDGGRFEVIEHGRDFDSFRFIAARPIYGETIRILVPGGINAAKGAEVLREIADADALGQIEWHILGPIKEKFESAGSRVVYHGPYKRENFGALVEKIAPHAGAVLSIWDETYCHTLTEMWSVGLPVFVLDYANVAQRVRRFNAGWVLEGSNGPGLLAQMTEALYNRKSRSAAVRGVSDWQNGWGIAWTTKQMALNYLDIYRRILADAEAVSAKALRVGVLAPGSRDLTRAPSATFVRMWERTRNSVSRDIDYVRVTPDGAIAAVRQNLLDGLIVQRTAVPVEAAGELTEALHAGNVALIAELDEDLTATYPVSEGYREQAAKAPTLAGLLRGVGALSVSTDALRDRFAELDVPTEVFPAALSDRLWSQNVRPRVPDGKIRALYFGHKAHSADFELVLAALDIVASGRPDFEVMLVGVASGARLDEIKYRRPWLTGIEVPESVRQYPKFVEWLRERSEQSDFAIAPLAETELNVHRSDLKLLEFLGLGLRTVASDVGPYRETSIPGVTLVENTTDAWVDSLNRAIEDVDAGESHIQGLTWLQENRMLRQQQARFDAFIREAVTSANAGERR